MLTCERIDLTSEAYWAVQFYLLFSQNVLELCLSTLFLLTLIEVHGGCLIFEEVFKN